MLREWKSLQGLTSYEDDLDDKNRNFTSWNKLLTGQVFLSVYIAYIV